MIGNGYDREFAERTFKQLEGFGSYGFPESHAASFALIAYASSWMKCHHPEVFLLRDPERAADGLLRAGPARARRPAHGVEVRWVDVGRSDWDCTLEPAGDGRLAVRLGLRMVRGLAEADALQVGLCAA